MNRSLMMVLIDHRVLLGSRRSILATMMVPSNGGVGRWLLVVVSEGAFDKSYMCVTSKSNPSLPNRPNVSSSSKFSSTRKLGRGWVKMGMWNVSLARSFRDLGKERCREQKSTRRRFDSVRRKDGHPVFCFSISL
jgi:hypothetical protein